MSKRSTSFDHEMNKNSIAASKVVSILLILAIAVAMPVGQAYAILKVTRMPIVYGEDANSHAVIQSASVYLDDVYVGTTNSQGGLTIAGPYTGAHQLSVSKDGYNTYQAMISITPSNRTFTAYLTTALSKTLFWACNFESGNHAACFNVPNGQNIAPGNSPGEIVTNLVHSGMYASYYYITSNPTGGWVRDYWSIDWAGRQPTTHDFIVEAWIYVPTQTIIGTASFITIGFDGYNSITIDLDSRSLPKRYLMIWNAIFTDTYGYQTINSKVELPFDKWVKLEVEVHYRPSIEMSNVILYQDNVKIVDFTTHARDAQPRHLLNMHFGLYVGAEVQTFSVYNDDLALYIIG